MKRDRSGRAADEAHVFDQTNGVVDLGTTGSGGSDSGEPNRFDREATAGFAILSTQKP